MSLHDRRIVIVLARNRPALLVFPNLPLLSFWFFNTGLVSSATAMLAAQASGPVSRCGYDCTILAVGVLLSVALVLVATLTSAR